MNRLTRAYVQFYWNSNRDVLLSKDTEHHTDIIEGLRKKDATSVASRISFSRHDKQNMKKSDIPPNREAKLLCPAVLFHEKNEISKILHTK